MDIDVATLHQGYLAGLRRRGGQLVTDAGVTSLRRKAGVWTAATRAGAFAAPIVLNAAGAWADAVAALAGLAPLGLAPKRRTVALIPGPDLDFAAWPLVIEAGESFYFKPDAGRLLISPADETDSAPTDAQPEDLDVAIAVDRIERATTMSIRRITHRWAGLRTFAPDRTPVCGFDPHADGFFWLAGQGGYGIQSAAALAKRTARLIGGAPAADEIDRALSPGRFRPTGRPPSASRAP
jgi:D-arginine dehydrogenase